jgi:hypothetical protein
MRVVVLAAVIGVAAACTKATSPNANEAECQQYRDKLFSLLPDAEREAVTRMGLQKASPYELALCQQRMTSDEIACAVTKTTQADALACKPKVDIRPADAKRTPEECAKAGEHIMKLADVFDKNEGIGPPFTKSMAAMLARECDRWMTKERYDCILKAGMPMDLMGCRP